MRLAVQGACLAWALAATISAAHAQSPATPSHVVQVTLASGKQLTLEAPSSRIHLEFPDFTLDTPIHVVDRIVPAANGKWQVTFNDGEVMLASRLSGEINYKGDFGQAKLAWSAVRQAVTLRNDDRQRTALGLPGATPRIDLKFRNGMARAAQPIGFRSVTAKLGGLEAYIELGRAQLDFDWTKGEVRATLANGTSIDFTLSPQPQPKVQVTSDLGDLTFSWRDLVQSRPVGVATQAGETRCTLQLAGGGAYPMTRVDQRPGIRLGGHNSQVIDWEQMTRLRPPEGGGAGTVTFRDGTQLGVATDMLSILWPLGRVNVPFAAKSLVGIDCPAPDQAAPAKNVAAQRIRLAGGEEWSGTLDQIYGFDNSTTTGTFGVLHLVSLPTSFGAWLAEPATLTLTNANGRLSVEGLAHETYAVSASAAPHSAIVKTRNAQYQLPLAEVAAVAPLTPAAERNERAIAVAIRLRDGTTRRISCAGIELVRYPDRIWNGTMYSPSLGAWYWHRTSSFAVKDGEAEMTVEFRLVKRVRFSGSYPAWTVEVEGNKSGTLLKGRMVPAPVAARGPGVASWNEKREGFWFDAPGGRAFLFVPMSAIAEIEIAPGG